MTFLRPVLCLVAALLLSACADLMRVDFETDPVGEPPVNSPPSDELDLVTFEEGPGQIIVVNSGAVTGNRSLRLLGPSATTQDAPSVRFQAQPLSGTGRIILMQWMGRITPGAEVRLQVGAIEGGEDNPLLPALSFRDGSVFLGGLILMPYDVQREHLISVVVDMTNGSYRIVLERGFSETLVLNNTPSNGGSAGQTIWLDVTLESAGNGGTYTIDSVFAQDRTPPP